MFKLNSFCNYFILGWLNFKSILKKIFCKAVFLLHFINDVNINITNYVLYQISHMAVNFIHHFFTNSPPSSTMLTVFFTSFYFHYYEIRFIFWKIPKFILWKFNCVDADILYECLQTFMKEEKWWKTMESY